MRVRARVRVRVRARLHERPLELAELDLLVAREGMLREGGAQRVALLLQRLEPRAHLGRLRARHLLERLGWG